MLTRPGMEPGITIAEVTTIKPDQVARIRPNNQPTWVIIFLSSSSTFLLSSLVVVSKSERLTLLATDRLSAF